MPILNGNEPNFLNQSDFNDLARDLNLSKHGSELLGSRLQERNLLAKGTNITVHRKRSERFKEYYAKVDDLCFCTDVAGLISDLFGSYNSEEWRLFIDGCVRSLKAVLLHIGNEKPSIPVAHSSCMKESYSTLKTLLLIIKYDQHNWKICGDLKVILVFNEATSTILKFYNFFTKI
jgi:hypothetical protein